LYKNKLTDPVGTIDGDLDGSLLGLLEGDRLGCEIHESEVRESGEHQCRLSSATKLSTSRSYD